MIDARDRPGLPRYSAAKGGGLRCYPEPRDLAGVDKIVLHQWGAHAALRQMPGETLDACAVRRARSVPYHLSVFAGGVVVWAWPATVSAWASNGFNRTSVAIGVAGRFPGLERHRTETHSSVDDFAAGLAEALAAVAAVLPGAVVVTHRQASKARLADPGEALARVAARTVGAMGLRLDFDTTRGAGVACPASWRGQ